MWFRLLAPAILATMYRLHTGPVEEAEGFWQGTLIHGRSDVDSAGTSLRIHDGADHHQQAAAFVHPHQVDQRPGRAEASLQACFTSGLLLTGTLYVVHANDIPRSIVLITVGLVAVSAEPAQAGLSPLSL